MKIKLFIVALAIPLLSTKCAEERVFLTVKNKSNSDVAIACTKDTVLLKEMYERGTYVQTEFNTTKKSKTNKIPFSESDLNFYFSKDKKSYTFYFFRYSIKDTFNNIIQFEKQYDSINVHVDDVNIGEGKNNIFIYDGSKIKFVK
jgi:hypothetical protein